MTDDDDKEHEAFKKKSSEQRLANAEPGIALKVVDSEEQKQISEVVTELTEKPILTSLPASIMQDQPEIMSSSMNFQSFSKEKPGNKNPKEPSILARETGVCEPLEGAELFKEVKKLPLFFTGSLVMLLSFSFPAQTVVLCYIYSVFCQYRTSRVVKNITATKSISPIRVLFVSLLPIYFYIGAILVRVLVNVGLLNVAGSWIILILAIVSIATYVFYQFRWPIMASVAIRDYDSRRNGKKFAFPAFLVHFLTGVSCNLLPPFLVIGGMIVNVFFRDYFQYSTGYLVALTIGMIVSQFAGYYFLRRRIRSAVLFDNDSKIAFSRQQKAKVKVSDDDFVVRYRGFAEWERWFKQRFSQPSYKKLFYLLAVAAVFFAVGAPKMALDFMMSYAPGMTGVGGAGGTFAGGDTINFLNMFQTFLISSFGIFGILYLSKPTHLGFSPKGVRFLWRHPGLKLNGKYSQWNLFKQIRLVLPPGKTSPSDQRLLFDANAEKQNVEIKLACVLEVDDRERILKAIEAFAPELERDSSILETLQPPADNSYTELWLQALTAPPKRERFKPLSEGATLSDGRFKIVGQLGVGGQGTAYHVKDTYTNSSVVLKEFILPVYVDVSVRRQALERFENEARILKHLDHDQIVKLIDFFVEDHRSYLVLEHIEGKSLKQIVEEQGPLSEKQVIDLTKQMCTMLSYMHNLSPPVVHRDFTPDNLILRPDGKLKLVDFNVAQQTDSTATGTVVGKHSYLPPEQFRGTPVPQSDIYSLGATLHYLLTGQDPEPISVSRPQRVNSEISDAMNLFVAKATAVTLEARHQNISELTQECSDMFDSSSAALEKGLLDS